MNGLAEIQSYLGSCTEIRTKLEINIYASDNKWQLKEDLRESAFLCVAGGDHVSGFFPTTKYRKSIPRSYFGELIKARSLYWQFGTKPHSALQQKCMWEYLDIERFHASCSNIASMLISLMSFKMCGLIHYHQLL